MAEPTLVDHVLVAADRWPDRPAWTFDPGAEPSTTLTFADVARRSAGSGGIFSSSVGIAARQ